MARTSDRSAGRPTSLLRLPVALATAGMNVTLTLGDLLAADVLHRPLGRAVAPGGLLDRLLSEDGPLGRLLGEGGPLDRLLAPDGPFEMLTAKGGPLERLLKPGGALDRITEDGGLLDRMLMNGGLLERLLVEDGFVEKLVAEGGTLDQLVLLGERLEELQPRLVEVIAAVPELRDSIDVLGETVIPLAELANRLPGGRRRAAQAQAAAVLDT